MCLGSAEAALRTVNTLCNNLSTQTNAQLPSSGAGSLVHVWVFPSGPGKVVKMSNEPPPPYPGGPTAPLLEEKSGAPTTPGRVHCS